MILHRNTFDELYFRGIRKERNRRVTSGQANVLILSKIHSNKERDNHQRKTILAADDEINLRPEAKWIDWLASFSWKELLFDARWGGSIENEVITPVMIFMTFHKTNKRLKVTLLACQFCDPLVSPDRGLSLHRGLTTAKSRVQVLLPTIISFSSTCRCRHTLKNRTFKDLPWLCFVEPGQAESSDYYLLIQYPWLRNLHPHF